MDDIDEVSVPLSDKFVPTDVRLPPPSVKFSIVPTLNVEAYAFVKLALAVVKLLETKVPDVKLPVIFESPIMSRAHVGRDLFIPSADAVNVPKKLPPPANDKDPTLVEDNVPAVVPTLLIVALSITFKYVAAVIAATVRVPKKLPSPANDKDPTLVEDNVPAVVPELDIVAPSRSFRYVPAVRVATVR